MEPYKKKSMLSNANFSNGFLVEALATFVHLIKRSPNKKLDLKVVEKIYKLGSHPLTIILDSLAMKHITTF